MSEGRDPLMRSKIKKKLDDNDKIVLFSGTANIPLSEEIAERLGISLGKISIRRYSDGEILIEVLEEIGDKEVYIIQPTCNPVNENLLELLLIINAAKKGSAKRVNVIIPYFGYSTLDKKVHEKVPIAAADVSKMLELSGADRVACLELHSGQTLGFFTVPADNVDSNILLIDYLLNSNLIRSFNNLKIVSPNENGTHRAKKFADILMSKTQTDITTVSLINDDYKGNVPKLIGDVNGNECLLLHDIIEEGSLIIDLAEVLYKNGATKVFVFATHGLLTSEDIEKIKNSRIDKVVMSNTIPVNKKLLGRKFSIISAASLIAEMIRRHYHNESLSEMFLL